MVEKYRKQLKLNTEDDLRYLRVNIKRNEETIERLTTEDQPFRVIDLVTKARAKLAEMQTQEEELISKIDAIIAGEYDADLEANIKETAATIQRKAEVTRAKKPKTAPPVFKQFTRQHDGVATDREMAYEHDRFQRSCNKFPEKLAEKLIGMPSNHGIIFNQIYFMGKKPPRAPLDTLVMQDKQGDDFFIKYITATECTTYLKKGYGRNTKEILVSKEIRQSRAGTARDN